MKQCWVCGVNVKPNTIRYDCPHCRGHVVTPETPPKRNTEELSFRELERMMSSTNTYERRNGKIKPRRYGQ